MVKRQVYLSKKILATFSFLEKNSNADLLLASFYYMNKTHRILHAHGRVNKESSHFYPSAHNDLVSIRFS